MKFKNRHHGERNQKSSCPPRGGVMWGDWLRRYKGTFWSDKNVFSLVLNIGYMGVADCQNLANWIFMIWGLCKLYLICIFLNKEENSKPSCQDSRVRSYNVRATKMRDGPRDSLPNGLASLLQWRGCYWEVKVTSPEWPPANPRIKTCPKAHRLCTKLPCILSQIYSWYGFFITIITNLAKHWPNGHLITLV